MLFIHYPNNGWWELDKENLIVYNYMGGHHCITESELQSLEIKEFETWHKLYEFSHFCPFQTKKYPSSAWISPKGIFYEADAHEIIAEYLCDIIYGEEPMWAGDYLENKGWIRVSNGLMWQVRIDNWKDLNLTQSQLNSLFDWCKHYNLKFPY